MGWRKNRAKLGGRNLKIGLSGADVQQLQEYLTKFGYQTGPVDGHFGYLTQEALRSFQRDFRLRVDGIAGKQVFSLLKQDKLPIRRRVHIVKSGETIGQISQAYNVGPEAFGQYTTKLELYQGRNLVFFDREAWGIYTPNIAGQDSYQQNQSSLTGLLIPTSIYEELEIPEYAGAGCKMAMVDLGEGEEDLNLHQLLTNRKQRRASREYFKKVLEKVNGIYLPWETFSRVDGARYLKFISQLRPLAKNKRLMIGLTPETPRWNVLGGLDLKQVSKYVDQAVIGLPVPQQSASFADKARFECLVHSMLRYMPSYKLLLRVPTYALEWSMEEDRTTVSRFTHATAMSRVFRYAAKMKAVQGEGLYYSFHHKEIEKHLRIVSIKELNQLLNLVNRYNLAGIVLDRLGMEDKRLWQVIRSHFRTGKFL